MWEYLATLKEDEPIVGYVYLSEFQKVQLASSMGISYLNLHIEEGQTYNFKKQETYYFEVCNSMRFLCGELFGNFEIHPYCKKRSNESITENNYYKVQIEKFENLSMAHPYGIRGFKGRTKDFKFNPNEKFHCKKIKILEKIDMEDIEFVKLNSCGRLEYISGYYGERGTENDPEQFSGTICYDNDGNVDLIYFEKDLASYAKMYSHSLDVPYKCCFQEYDLNGNRVEDEYNSISDWAWFPQKISECGMDLLYSLIEKTKKIKKQSFSDSIEENKNGDVAEFSLFDEFLGIDIQLI